MFVSNHGNNAAYLNSRGGGGEGDQGTSSLIAHGGGGGGEQVVDAADETGTLRGVGVAHLE